MNSTDFRQRYFGTTNELKDEISSMTPEFIMFDVESTSIFVSESS